MLYLKKTCLNTNISTKNGRPLLQRPTFIVSKYVVAFNLEELAAIKTSPTALTMQYRLKMNIYSIDDRSVSFMAV